MTVQAEPDDNIRYKEVMYEGNKYTVQDTWDGRGVIVSNVKGEFVGQVELILVEGHRNAWKTSVISNEHFAIANTLAEALHQCYQHGHTMQLKVQGAQQEIDLFFQQEA